jgi:DNA-3-methyladenine glycosylase I
VDTLYAGGPGLSSGAAAGGSGAAAGGSGAAASGPGVAASGGLSVARRSVPAVDDLVTGADGRTRCGWAGASPIYLDYHDDEWGVPQHDDVRLFEKLCLEAFQSGLSWLTILRKRESFRAAFAGFVPERVAGFGEPDVTRLLADAGIVRNRAKIEAAIANARATLELPAGLSALLWSFAPDPAARQRPASFADLTATTPESTAMAKDLRKRGFRFVGPTTAYALMQACGLVDDHLVGCWRAQEQVSAR